ncbi:MAG: type II toxin-antitoxin system Phd/YefM family antitoxin [Phycisphaerales bacterium]|nr:type II toxin-antitoxin system Phd/YefM family antitoxin [Phycisphaerales bacterium]
MIRTDNIRKLSDFRQNATSHLDRLADSGEAEVLTVNGEAKGVVMSPKAFDAMAEKAALLDSLKMIDLSMEDIKAGRTHDAKETIQKIATKHGLTLDQ